jgi:hypothetical protein
VAGLAVRRRQEIAPITSAEQRAPSAARREFNCRHFSKFRAACPCVIGKEHSSEQNNDRENQNDDFHVSIFTLKPRDCICA